MRPTRTGLQWVATVGTCMLACTLLGHPCGLPAPLAGGLVRAVDGAARLYLWTGAVPMNAGEGADRPGDSSALPADWPQPSPVPAAVPTAAPVMETPTRPEEAPKLVLTSAGSTAAQG